MTLVAPLKPPAHHKKTSGKHHRHTKTYHKPYWPYLPVVGIVLAGVLLSNLSWIPGKPSVLGYATDMSVQELLDDTNSQRASNGIAAVALNGRLDTAAQAKANDMAARGYWSHNTPDGKTPWTFITAAGYSYQLAGENLAYGFGTASATLTGWMNSPAHRANILNGGYSEVGFGYVNIANYQGSGPETLVVAMYAAPASALAQAAASTGFSPPPTNSETLTPKDTIIVPSNTALKNIQEPAQEHVSRSQLLTGGLAPWSGLAISLIGAGAIALYIFRHGVAWHKVIRRGELLVLHHPLADLGFVVLGVLAVVLSHSAGVIR